MMSSNHRRVILNYLQLHLENFRRFLAPIDKYEVIIIQKESYT